MNEQPEKEVAPDAQDGSVFENQRADAFPSSKSATREARREWCSRIRPEPHQPDSDESSGLVVAYSLDRNEYQLQVFDLTVQTKPV